MDAYGLQTAAKDLGMGLPDGLFSHIERVLHLFGVAEELAEQYKQKRPDRPVFKWLKYMEPPAEMIGLVDDLFAAHCRELFERGIAFMDEQEKEKGYKVYVPRGAMGRVMEQGTAAEALLVLAKTSEKVPLHGDPTALYISLFRRCMPDRVSDPKLAAVFETGDRFAGKGSYDGVLDHIEQDIRQKCARNRDTKYDGSGERVQRWDESKAWHKPKARETVKAATAVSHARQMDLFQAVMA